MKLFKLASLAAGFSLISMGVGAETVKICYDQWPPMTIFPSPEMPERGAIPDIFSDIYTKAGFDPVFIEVPYARGMEMVASGQCDLLPEMAYTDEPQEEFVFADQATFEYPMGFIMRRDENWSYKGPQSIGRLRVATGPGWDYSSMSKEYQAFLDDPDHKNQVEVIAGDEDVVSRIFEMIASNRVDIYADNVFVLKYLLSQNGMSDVLKVMIAPAGMSLLEKPIISTNISSEKQQKILSIWNEGRKSLSSGDIERYFAKYGVSF